MEKQKGFRDDLGCFVFITQIHASNVLPAHSANKSNITALM